jgi:TonB-dependent receptor
MTRNWRGGHRDVFTMGILAGLVASAYAQTPVEQDKTTQSVTVSGFRSSLALSANEKRDNVGLTDTVFSEDMGKFPDPNIADALARVPGVQVTRASIDGEGMNVSIRGMGPAFTRVLLNGAPMASASGGNWGGGVSANREVDMDFLPAELFRSASVYKSQQADLVEGGLAGTVNMRSVRPFDKSGFRSAITLSGNYRDQDKKWGDTGSALVSNTWKTPWGKMGLLGGFAWGDSKFHTDSFQSVEMRNFQLRPSQAIPSDKPNSTGGGSQSTPETVPAGLPLDLLPAYARSVLVPGATIDRAMLLALNPGATIQQIDNGLMGRLGRHIVYSGERKRKGEVLSFQWQPNDQWDVYLDTMFAQKGSHMVQEGMNVGTRASTPIPIGLEFDRSDCTYGCTITKGLLANTFWSLEYRPMVENTHFSSINPGFEWRPTDRWTIDGHVNFTQSSFYRNMPSVLLATKAAPSLIAYDNTVPGASPTFTGNLDPNNPANFGWFQGGQGLSGLRMDLFERTNTTKGTRLNLKWGDDDFDLKFGGSYDDTERRYRSYNVADSWMNVACGNNLNVRFFAPNTRLRGGCDGRSVPGVADANTAYPGYGTGATAGQTTPLAYLGSTVTNANVPQYAMPSNHGFITLDWNKFAADTDYQYFTDNLYNGPNGGGYIREKVTGLYLEANGHTPVLGRTLRYNAGVRYAQTEQTIGDLTSAPDPRNAALQDGGYYANVLGWKYETVKYHNMMPSATLAYNLTPSLIARASGSRTMTRANPADLRQTSLYIGDQGARQGSVTNPNLKPYEANNLDLGLEYYMTREAYVALSGFAKDIISRPGTRINTYTLAQLDQMYGTVNLSDAQLISVATSGGRDKHTVEIVEPYNLSSKLKVRGLEFTWQQPLDMLPVKGFGFTGNVTYARQEDEALNAPPVAGVPPRTNNLTLYYERDGVNLRVARQYTSAMITNTSTGLTAPGGVYAYSTPRTQVDLSAGLNLKRVFGFAYNADLTFSAWNLTNAVTKNYTQFPNAVFDEVKPGRSYTMSLRSTF